jgi:hypothetical protein
MRPRASEFQASAAISTTIDLTAEASLDLSHHVGGLAERAALAIVGGLRPELAPPRSPHVRQQGVPMREHTVAQPIYRRELQLTQPADSAALLSRPRLG